MARALLPLLCLAHASLLLNGAHCELVAACPTVEEDADHSVSLLQVRANALQVAVGSDEVSSTGPGGIETTLPEVSELVTILEGQMSGMVTAVNETIVEVLLQTVTAMRSMDDVMEVAQTTAESAGAILGAKGAAVVEELTKMAEEMRSRLSEAVSHIIDFRKSAEAGLFAIQASVNSSAYGLLQRFGIAVDKTGQTKPSGDANTPAPSPGPSSNASSSDDNSTDSGPNQTTLLQVGAQQLQAGLADGCLTMAEAEGAVKSLSFLDADKEDAAVHFRRLDADADGCVSQQEWQQESQLSSDSQAVALLVVRATRGTSYGQAQLDGAVRRKGGSDPCQTAKMAISRANSSIITLGEHLQHANATLFLLLDQAADMGEKALMSINETVQSGIEAAKAIGLPQATLNPISDGLKKTLSVSGDIIKEIDESKGNVSSHIGKLAKSATQAFYTKTQDLVSNIADACALAS